MGMTTMLIIMDSARREARGGYSGPARGPAPTLSRRDRWALVITLTVALLTFVGVLLLVAGVLG